MFPVKPVAVLSFASSAVTCTAGVMLAPATALVDALVPVEAVMGDVAATLDCAPETVLATTSTDAVWVIATVLMVADTVFDSATSELSVPVATPSVPVGLLGWVTIFAVPVAV